MAVQVKLYSFHATFSGASMEKKKKKKKMTWLSILKRLFVSEPHSRWDKCKRKRWIFRLHKMKELAPLSPGTRETVVLPWETADEEDDDEQVSATRIQAAFRGYLARKALRALKGVVKLQALIRGWAVRQQAINTLKCLQSIVNIQTEVCSKRCERIFKDSLHCQEHKSPDLRERDIKVDLNSQKRWNDSTMTKDEIEAFFLTKKEASIKRERIKEYYLNHRRSAEIERDKAYGRQRYWLEQWVDAHLAKSNTPTNLERNLSANARNINDQVSDSPTYIPRRSHHHRKQHSIGDESSIAGSPAYMASTQSAKAKAKARSLSSPRLRPHSFDVCSEIISPYTHKLSPISSINSELTSSSWVGINRISSSQRSPHLKGLVGPVKSNMSTKDLRLRGIAIALTSER